MHQRQKVGQWVLMSCHIICYSKKKEERDCRICPGGNIHYIFLIMSGKQVLGTWPCNCRTIMRITKTSAGPPLNTLPRIKFQLKSNSRPTYKRTRYEGNANLPSANASALRRCRAARQMCAARMKYATRARAVQLGGPPLGTAVCKQTDGV